MPDLTLNEYQKLAGRTAATGREPERRKIISALGIAGEAGEFANLIKKLSAHGHAIDNHTLADELGDILWYLAEAATACDLTLEEIAMQNVAKLQKRYPEGFSEQASINREE